MNRRPLPSEGALSLPQGLRDFEGTWRLSRRITDRRVGQTGHAVGRVVLERDGSGLSYHESVTLHLPGQLPIEGTRCYRWHACDDGIAVAFDDGRPFHTIALDRSRPEADHWCDPDEYDVVYDFVDWPVWTVTWEVQGPRKDYRMETLFARERPKRTET